MYGFPADLNLDDLIGDEIVQLCLGRADCQFVFGSGRRICVQGDMDVLQGEGLAAHWDENHGWTSTAFQQLLMTRIEGYARINAQLLEIVFDNGLRLQLHDSGSQFESVQIYPEMIIV